LEGKGNPEGIEKKLSPPRQGHGNSTYINNSTKIDNMIKQSHNMKVNQNGQF